MHFIELLFGLSPDGGTGVSELVFLVALLAVVLTLVQRVVRYRTFAHLLVHSRAGVKPNDGRSAGQESQVIS